MSWPLALLVAAPVMAGLGSLLVQQRRPHPTFTPSQAGAAARWAMARSTPPAPIGTPSTRLILLAGTGNPADPKIW